MNYRKSILALEQVLEKSNEISEESASSTTFIIWKNLAYRTLEKVFGSASTELSQFASLDFSFKPLITYLGEDYSYENQNSFRNDFLIATETIKSYIQELKLIHEDVDQQPSVATIHPSLGSSVNKIFISHSSADKEIVEDLIELLEGLGLNNQIFCSPIPEYSIALGEDFLERIKHELDNYVLVLFILSDNFYKSPVCLCEMGATWMKTNEHIPILVPPLEFRDIKGVIPLTQGFKINDKLGLNQFKDKIQQLFSLDIINPSTWERKRDRFLKNISDKFSVGPVVEPVPSSLREKI